MKQNGAQKVNLFAKSEIKGTFSPNKGKEFSNMEQKRAIKATIYLQKMELKDHFLHYKDNRIDFCSFCIRE